MSRKVKTVGVDDAEVTQLLVDLREQVTALNATSVKWSAEARRQHQELLAAIVTVVDIARALAALATALATSVDRIASAAVMMPTLTTTIEQVAKNIEGLPALVETIKALANGSTAHNVGVSSSGTGADR